MKRQAGREVSKLLAWVCLKADEKQVFGLAWVCLEGDEKAGRQGGLQVVDVGMLRGRWKAGCWLGVGMFRER